MTHRNEANENPWYVLMTLFGEQNENHVDLELHKKNRQVWNSWAGSRLSPEEQEEYTAFSQIDIAELKDWSARSVEIQRLHKRAMKNRNNSHFVYPGFPNPNSNVDLSETEFFKLVVLDELVFPQLGNFNSSVFNHSVLGSKSFYFQGMSFVRARFLKLAQFTHVCVKRDADFRDATFDALTHFDGSHIRRARFSRAIFGQVAKIDKSVFLGPSSFDQAKFLNDVVFEDSVFEDANFQKAEFSKTVSFNRVSFQGNAKFSSSVFNGFTYFVGASFETVRNRTCISPNFSECQFEKPTDFRKAIFKDFYPVFTGATLHEKTSFTANPENWPSSLDSNLDEARENCEIIRHLLSGQGLHEQAHFFYRREMEFAGRIGNFWQKLPYKIFRILSDYGYSIALPLKFLAIVLIAPLGAYTAILEGPDEGFSFINFFKAIGFSFSNTFKFFGLQKVYFSELLDQLDMVLSFVTGAQTVSGFVLVFFLGLGLRTRFRLR
ncbi:pentapeptide repeat-containing protein [Pseudohalocynthiibacter sp. F2068]|uniref:pentapeptide repeat-containing protein n=1 Tax=Pseudohalocynthiibacter sp. F2068 TaxID=2926418 RepID=UPI001FF3EF7F|nr:pentapeptide repeat-containing protein [Pseudohalocynthiibacter sp. F2068]